MLFLAFSTVHNFFYMPVSKEYKYNLPFGTLDHFRVFEFFPRAARADKGIKILFQKIHVTRRDLTTRVPVKYLHYRHGLGASTRAIRA